jgi:1,4-alpha-glucan branching enzyme
MMEEKSSLSGSDNTIQRRYEEIHFVDSTKPVWNYSLFSQADIDNFQNGTHYTLYKLFGNKQLSVLDTPGTYFSVWAPNATYISVIGEFNDWNKDAHPLMVRMESSGIWEGFIPNITTGQPYKYYIKGYQGLQLEKGDPFAHHWQKRPSTSSVTWDTNYEWKDEAWMKSRKNTMH